ncbi:MAG: hypothetical protein ACREVK_04505 [Gammaproteobacteria bacterium]
MNFCTTGSNCADLARKGYLARTIGIKLGYVNFRTLTRAVTLERAIADAEAIRAAARACLKRVTLDRRLRLLGIRIAGLVRPGQGADHSTIDRSSLEPTNQLTKALSLRNVAACKRCIQYREHHMVCRRKPPRRHNATSCSTTIVLPHEVGCLASDPLEI